MRACIFWTFFVATLFCNRATIAADAETEHAETEATPKRCIEVCIPDNIVVCGYNGDCYREYPNKCAYDYEKCSKHNHLETVDSSLCDLARKNDHPKYQICAD